MKCRTRPTDAGLPRVGLAHARNAALLAAAVLAVYAPALTYGFVWDDYHFVGPYAARQVLARFWGTWDPQGIESPFYRPLVIVSYALDHTLWDMNPAGYHLTNLLLHTAAAVALYALLFSYTASRAASCAGALIFALRPSNAIAATWISGRTDSLATLFCILAALAFRNRGKWALAACVGAFVLALGCKEVAAVLPLLLLADVTFFPGRGRGKKLTAVFAALAVYLILRVAMFGGVGGRGDHWVMLTKAAQSAARMGDRVVWSVLPSSAFLRPEVMRNAPIWFDEPAEPQHWLGVVLYGVLLLAGLRLLTSGRRPYGVALLGMAWIVLPCVPSLGVPGLRNLYMSCVGSAVLTCRVLSGANTRRSRALCSVAFMAIGLVCADFGSRYRDVLAPTSGFVVGHDLEAAIYWRGRLTPEAHSLLAARLRAHGPLLERKQREAERWAREVPSADHARFALGMILAYRSLMANGPEAHDLRSRARDALGEFLLRAPRHPSAERARQVMQLMGTDRG